MRASLSPICLILLASLFTATTSAAQPTANAQPVAPARVLVELDGGLAANNLVRVLARLEERGLRVPSRPVEVREGETLCSILNGADFPPPCSTLASHLGKDKAFPGTPNGSVSQGQVVNLPDIKPSIRTVVKSEPRYLDTQRKLNERLQAWQEHSAEQLPKYTETEVAFKHRLYVTTFTFDSAVQAKQAALAIEELKLPNVTLDLIIPNERPNLHAGILVDTVQQACQKSMVDSVTSSYLQMFDRDLAAVQALKEWEGRVASRDRQTTPIYLIDTKLSAMPNLYPAFGPEVKAIAAACQWAAFDKDKHHANHLAGIIASQGKGYGFEGIAPSAVLRSYNMFANGSETQQEGYLDLPQYIESNAYAKPVRIFLMAHSRRAQQYGEYLPNKKYRTQMERLGKTICCRGMTRPFVVAAAGDTSKGININAQTNMFPQVLGDAGNVLVVSACVNCDKAGATLLPGANHSAEEETSKFVHVAAPGGAPIPGWTDSNLMGAIAGTSQAAAFAAGIAAIMLNNYPSVYQEFGVLKLRMQACSWPLPYHVGGELNHDARKLAAGVLDPAICALDPNVAWVKREGIGWSGAPFRRFIAPPSGAFIKETAERSNTEMKDVLRIMKTDKSGEAAWTIYSRQPPAEHEFERGWGQIKKEVAANIDKKVQIEFCDGSKMALTDFNDVLLPAVNAECPDQKGMNSLAQH
jgi:hypothetical protein